MANKKTTVDLKRKRQEEESAAPLPHPFSIEDHAIRCQQIIVNPTNNNPSLLKNYFNFIQTGPPQRVLLHENGDWIDFLEERDIDLVDEGFSKNKTVLFEVDFRGTPYLADFLHMVLIDLATGSQRPIGWINKAGKCFFPVKIERKMEEEKKEEEQPIVTMEDLGKSKPMRALPQEKLDTFKRLLTQEEKQHFFLNMDNIDGMNDFMDERAKARLKLFENRIEIIESRRDKGSANVRYAWLATSKEKVARILRDGLVMNDLPKVKPSYGLGVHLASASSSHICARYCDIDENGLQHMLLCRVILGNMEHVHPGSRQFCPTSKMYDSALDDFLNPKHYIVWNKNMNTHIYPEYVVRFKRPPIGKGHQSESRSKDTVPVVEDSSACQKKLQPNVSPVNSAENCQPAGISQGNNSTIKSTAGNLCSISQLLTEMKDKVPPNVMKIVYQLYDQLKQNKMSKEQLLKMMRLVVGEHLLRDALMALCPKKQE